MNPYVERFLLSYKLRELCNELCIVFLDRNGIHSSDTVAGVEAVSIDKSLTLQRILVSICNIL